ncbi:2-C-methyl-D-erythritol 2,4-cyclodiphosphate synthase [Sedimenticola selenatireducens]|uniref:2-C-methyl-D-erythritol 2,4-cyclodiphosphate synthase n=1 Tax=Sedimenticola selenatireducens TaxID=191960 RepID=A0A2N6CRY8_9GAMM|nr:2-C-methyl-D-erythritol 2,4-cyclodiphosphate synthase [Sedimenticola selenatireducens]PLX59853.1 MAG: 2-C-methyl-D-erythritol 2,4-cyclodiphosphate synthase [Sedimenticola selenatireducens]
MRIGQGYDAHRFTPGRPLILGGVEIDYPLGMEAHSDGDVLIHALCDALLGAAGLRDIGYHFPDSSAEYKNIDSRHLLTRVMGLLDKEGWMLGNADITVVAQAPKLSPHIESMREHMSEDLRTPLKNINIKATTTEGMGFAWRGEGIACYAVVLLQTVTDQPL